MHSTGGQQHDGPRGHDPPIPSSSSAAAAADSKRPSSTAAAYGSMIRRRDQISAREGGLGRELKGGASHYAISRLSSQLLPCQMEIRKEAKIPRNAAVAEDIFLSHAMRVSRIFYQSSQLELRSGLSAPIILRHILTHRDVLRMGVMGLSVYTMETLEQTLYSRNIMEEKQSPAPSAPSPSICGHVAVADNLSLFFGFVSFFILFMILL